MNDMSYIKTSAELLAKKKDQRVLLLFIHSYSFWCLLLYSFLWEKKKLT